MLQELSLCVTCDMSSRVQYLRRFLEALFVDKEPEPPLQKLILRVAWNEVLRPVEMHNNNVAPESLRSIRELVYSASKFIELFINI
jgi:hypothetical protein